MSSITTKNGVSKISIIIRLCKKIADNWSPNFPSNPPENFYNLEPPGAFFLVLVVAVSLCDNSVVVWSFGVETK